MPQIAALIKNVLVRLKILRYNIFARKIIVSVNWKERTL